MKRTQNVTKKDVVVMDKSNVDVYAAKFAAISRNPDSQDALQNAVVSILQSKSDIQNFKAYLGTSYNRALKREKMYSRNSKEHVPYEDTIATPVQTPEVDVHALLKYLTPKKRRVVSAYLSGITFKTMDGVYETNRAHYRQAIAIMRDMLNS